MRRGRLTVVQVIAQSFQEFNFLGDLLVAGLGLTGGRFQALLYGGEVGQNQFRHEIVQIAAGIHIVRDGGIVEAADHNGQRVGVADMAQELGAQPLAFCGLSRLAKTGHIHELYCRRHDFTRMKDLRQALQAGIGHLYHGAVGLYGTGRVTGDLGAGSGQGVE